MKKAKTLYIDIDDTLADFWSAAAGPNGEILEYKMWSKDFFLNLEPLPGAKGAIFDLSKMGFDLWILTQPLAECPESYSDKAKWVQLHFPQLYKKLILTQDKGLKSGHYLIDDNAHKWKTKFEKNGGTFVHFPYGGYNFKSKDQCPSSERSWREVVEFFRKENPFLD